jgi:hypothetical protein
MPMAWMVSMGSLGGGGASSWMTSAVKEPVRETEAFFFIPLVFFGVLTFSEIFSLSLALSAASLSLKPSQILAILWLRLTSETSLMIFFYFFLAGAVWDERVSVSASGSVSIASDNS